MKERKGPPTVHIIRKGNKYTEHERNTQTNDKEKVKEFPRLKHFKVTQDGAGSRDLYCRFSQRCRRHTRRFRLTCFG